MLVKRRKTATVHLAQCNAKQGHGSIHQGVGVGLAVCVGGWTQLLVHLPGTQPVWESLVTRAPLYALSTSAPVHLHTRFARTQCNCYLIMHVLWRVSVHRVSPDVSLEAASSTVSLQVSLERWNKKEENIGQQRISTAVEILLRVRG